MLLNAGTTVDRYVLERPIGRGGMATVWAVRHAQLGSHHALKVLHVAGSGLRDLLLQEGRIQARIRHPHLVTVTDVVDVGGAPGLIMELVEGPNLEQWLARTRPSLGQIDALAAGILDGLAAAHAAGLVHRDLKPGNILLAVEGSSLSPKITDFGLARVLAGEGAGGQQTRGVMGTPSYMAPEQIQDTAGVDARADVFAAGAVLYELATGKRCFPGDDVFGVFEKIRTGRYTPPQEVAPELPDRIARAIERALVVDPEARIGSCLALREAWAGEQRSNPWELEQLAAARALGHGTRLDDTTAAPSPTWGADEGPASVPAGPVAMEREVTLAAPLPSPALASGPTRRTAWWVFGALAITGAVAAAGWALRPQPRQVFTVDGPPQIDAPADVQADLDRAWLAWLEGDMSDSARLAHRVTVAAPDEAVGHLLYAIASADSGDTLEMTRGLKRIDELSKDAATEATAALIGTTDAAELAAACQRFAATWPEDLLVAAMCAVRAPASVEGAVERARALRERHPEAVFLWLIEANHLANDSRHAQVLALLDEAIARHPDAAILHTRRAMAVRDVGDVKAARSGLLKALAVSPGNVEARSMLAVVELESGQVEAFEAHDAALRSEATPAYLRAQHAIAVATTHKAWGRFHAAVPYEERAAAACLERGDHLGLAMHHLRLAQLHELVGDYDAVQQDLLQLRSAIAAPEVPETLRAHYTTRAVVRSGESAAASGNLELARAELERARAAGADARSVTLLELAIAVAERDPGRIGAVLKVLALPACDADRALGMALADAEAWDLAREPLERWRAGVDGCGAVMSNRFQRAHGTLRLAGVAWRHGRLDDARVALAEFHALWPDYDPKWRLAGEVAALDAALASP